MGGPAVAAGGAPMMRMITIPNQSSVAMAYKEFDEAGRMRPSSYCGPRRGRHGEIGALHGAHAVPRQAVVDRYSERQEAGAPNSPATDHSAIAIASPS